MLDVDKFVIRPPINSKELYCRPVLTFCHNFLSRSFSADGRSQLRNTRNCMGLSRRFNPPFSTGTPTLTSNNHSFEPRLGKSMSKVLEPRAMCAGTCRCRGNCSGKIWVNVEYPNPGPLHTPRAQVRVRPGANDWQKSASAASHISQPPAGHMHSTDAAIGGPTSFPCTAVAIASYSSPVYNLML